MSLLKYFIKDTIDLLTRLDIQSSLPTSPTMCLVISFRPNLGFESSAILNRDYNQYVNQFKEDKKEKKSKTEAVSGNKATPNRKKQITVNKDYLISCENAFDVLNGLNESCDEFNKNTDSSITPSSCVEKVVRLVDYKKVELLDFKTIMREHKQMLHEMLNQTKLVHELTSVKSDLERKIHLSEIDRHLTSAHPTPEKIEIKSENYYLNIGMLQNLLIQQESDIQKAKHMTLKRASLTIKLKLLDGLKKMSNKQKEVGYRSVCQDECIALGHIMPTLDKQSRAAVDPIIHKLIMKCNFASQAIDRLPTEYESLFNSIITDVQKTIIDLD